MKPTAKESRMRPKRRGPCRGIALLIALTLATAGMVAGQGVAPTKEQAEDDASFREFSDRVGEYLNLHKAVEKRLPALKNNEELPEMIAAHQQALARKIREARPHAKPGNIFTGSTREAFRHAIRGVFQDSQNATARTTVRQRKTGTGVRLQVNGIYPDAIAETSFPPTLLQQLPTLPDELAYRIVGRDLVLVDRRANLVVDLLHEALP
jgi:hypothetical protein